MLVKDRCGVNDKRSLLQPARDCFKRLLLVLINVEAPEEAGNSFVAKDLWRPPAPVGAFGLNEQIEPEVGKTPVGSVTKPRLWPVIAREERARQITRVSVESKHPVIDEQQRTIDSNVAFENLPWSPDPRVATLELIVKRRLILALFELGGLHTSDPVGLRFAAIGFGTSLILVLILDGKIDSIEVLVLPAPVQFDLTELYGRHLISQLDALD